MCLLTLNARVATAMRRTCQTLCSVKAEPIMSPLIGQASRAISTGQLNMLPCVHSQPINLVVFQDPLVTTSVKGNLILGGASCLDAFSAYPFRI